MPLMYPFDPDPRVYNEAQSLIHHGHEVTVMAWDKEPKEFAGFKNWRHRIYYKKDKSWWHPIKEDFDGIHVIRLRNTRLMQFIPYNIMRLSFWWNVGYKKALNIYKDNPFDVVHCHDFDTLPIGVKIKKKLDMPLIYDAHEIWGYMVARDLPQWWANYYLRKEKHIINNVDRIITVNEPLKKYFSMITEKPITIIMNCKPLQETSYASPKNNKFTLLYIGKLGKPRFILELVNVVESLPDVNCIIGGIGNPDYLNELKNKCSKVENVNFIGKVPMDDVLPMTKRADVVICMTSPDDPNNSRALANKQFEAMVCGRPIICTKDTYPGEFTEKEKCGITAYYTEEDLKKAIINLRDNPKLRKELGQNALNAAIKTYNWEKQEENLINAYRGLSK